MRPLVPVVFATDDEFAPSCSASIASLIANADPERSYRLYVFYDQLRQENIDRLNSMSTRNVSVQCRCITAWVTPNRELFYTRGRLTSVTYFRFFAADELTEYDKLLYLDSDIAVLGDVGELYDIEIGNNILGGVVIYRDRENERRLKEEYLRKLMDISPDRYINAGVLIMNLKGFRERGILNRCLEYLRSHRELRWLDQDVLNAVCRDQIHYLPAEWNTSQFYYEEDYLAGADVRGVRLIHYIDRIKPWMVDFRPSHLHFYRYAQQCPYADVLNPIFLENNKHHATRPGTAERKGNLVTVDISESRRHMLRLAKHGQLGPRFFIRCCGKWFEGKVSRMLKKRSRRAALPGEENPC